MNWSIGVVKELKWLSVVFPYRSQVFQGASACEVEFNVIISAISLLLTSLINNDAYVQWIFPVCDCVKEPVKWCLGHTY